MFGVSQVKREQVHHHAGNPLPHLNHAGRAVHAGKQKGADFLQVRPERRGKPHHRRARCPHIFNPLRIKCRNQPAAFADNIRNHHPEHPAQGLVTAPVTAQIGIERIHLGVTIANDRQGADVIIGEQFCTKSVLQVMVIIGNIVGQGRNLRLGTGIGFQLQIVAGVVFGQRIGQRARYGAVVFGQCLQRFPCQVQPVPFGVMPFQRCDDANGLCVVVKTAIRCHAVGQRVLAGVAKRRVPQIMGQRHRFGQFATQAQCPRDGPRHLRDLDRMGQAGAKIIALMLHKNLGLVFQPPKGGGMDDPVPIPLITGTKRAFVLGMEPSPGPCRIGRIFLKHMPACCRLLLKCLYDMDNRNETG